MGLFSRRSLMRRRRDGDFDLLLSPSGREVVRHLLGELDELLETDPGDANLRRLHPPAYLDDDEADAGYQILAGEELRTSRRDALAMVLDSLDRDQLTEDEVWGWAQSLNALRLVLGTRLDVSEDDMGPPADLDADGPETQLWSVYELVSVLQHEVVAALGG